jgi:mycofactocin biosynthesis protein MftB
MRPDGALSKERSPLDAAWRLHPQVALRPEPFGALAYNFENRRLSFLKNLVLVRVVEALDRHDSARDACAEAGVHDAKLPSFERALKALETAGMIERRRAG